MHPVEVDVGAGAAVLVGAFRQEGDLAALGEHLAGASFGLLAECVFFRALGGVACLGAGGALELDG